MSVRSGFLVGRVGALAAALGVGAAVFALPGVAAADTSGSAGASGAANSSDSTARGVRGPQHAAARSTAGQSTPRPASAVRGGVADDVVANGRQVISPAQVTNDGLEVPAVGPAPRRGLRGGGLAPAASAVPGVTRGPVVDAPKVAPSAAVVPGAAVSGASSGNPGAAAVAVSPSVVSSAAVVAASPAGSAVSAPVAAAKATPSVPPLIQKLDAQNQAMVRTIFHTLLNWTATLPVNSVTTWFEGALLMVRKSLFNQSAGVHSVQTANSPTLVTGKINVIDPEGDGWKVELVGDASHGAVTLGATSQKDGIGSTKYTYAPGVGYTGDDQFVVKVTPTQPVFNILHPFGVLDTRYYTVAVGKAADAAKDRVNVEGADPKDIPDTHLYMANAGATVTVKKQGFLNPKYAVTVTLPAVTAAKSFAWMDTRNNMGSVPVDTMLTKDWTSFSKKAAENGVQPLLAFKYSDQGVDKAVFVDVASVAKNSDGSYTLSGTLKDGVPAQEGRVDTWDFSGNRYKTAFDSFLNASNVKDCKSGQECTTVTAVGTLGMTTLSPSAFVETGGHDYPLAKARDSSALQTASGSMGPGTSGVGGGNGTEIFGNTGNQTLELTSMIPWGKDGSFISATNLTQAESGSNGIFLYSTQSPRGGAPTWAEKQLADNTWNAAVNVMASYNQVVAESTTYTATFPVVPGPTYTLTGNAGLPGMAPVSFVGSITGQQLNVESFTSDFTGQAFYQGDYVLRNGTLVGTVVSSNYDNFFGNVTVSAQQDVPTGALVAGQPAPGLNVSQASLTASGITDPGSLVGASVTGANVPAGTVIIGYDPISSGADTAVYKLNNVALSDTQPLTISTVVANHVTLAVPSGVDPSSLIGQTITGTGVPTGTEINGFVSSDATGVTYSVNNQILSAPASTAVTLPGLPATQPGLVVGLSDGSVYYWNGSLTGSFETSLLPDDSVTVVPSGNHPVSVAVAPDGNVYSLGDYLTVIGPSNTVIGTLPIQWNKGKTFPVVVVSPDGSFAYATEALPNDTAGVAVISTTSNTVVQNIQLPGQATAQAVAVSPDSTFGYIANGANYGGSPSVYRFNAATNTISDNIVLPDGSYPSGLAFSPDGKTLYVSDAANKNVSVIDTATDKIVTTIGLAGIPAALAVSPDGGSLIVTNAANYNANYVSVIDTSTNTLSNVIEVGNGPSGVAFNPNPALPYAYVTNSNDSTVSVIYTPTMSVVGTFASGAGGDDTLGVGVTADGLNVYLANYSGGGDSTGTVPVFTVANPIVPGWAQLQAGSGWGDGVAVNTIVALPNNNGFAVGLSNGQVAVWNEQINPDGTFAAGTESGCNNGSPGSCWTILPPGNLAENQITATSINAIIPSGQNGGMVIAGTLSLLGHTFGTLQVWDGSAWASQEMTGFVPTTLLPYDGTSLVGSISSAPVIATGGLISAPSYASLLPDLSASSAGCAWSYGSGAGTGCGGYVLTVQQAAGAPIRVGQTLYGGPGLASGTTITQQISDGAGNLQGSAAFKGGSTGVYLVDTSQLVAPGTPMSASDGTGYVVGTDDGQVLGFGNPLGSVVPPGTWASGETTMIPWRDGFVVGLNNGSVLYWSPSNTTTSPALTYSGSVIPTSAELKLPPGWTIMQGPGPEIPLPERSVTSLVQMGDGFAVGYTAENDTPNGEVDVFTGFGALSTSSAFGYLQTQPLAPENSLTNVNSQIPAGPSGAVGSVQQMVPIHQLVTDSNGNQYDAASLVVGLTDNGLYSWTGSNLNLNSSNPPALPWVPLQNPSDPLGVLNAANLQAAWTYGNQAPSGSSGAFGTAGSVGALYANGSGDPLFGVTTNQAWCANTGCSTEGDYTPIVFTKSFGNGGTIYSFGEDISVDINLSALGYGYLFTPQGVWDKFSSDNYSAALMVAVQGGPSVWLNPPGGLPTPPVIITDTWTGGPYTVSDTQETEIGSFKESVGISGSVTGTLTLNQLPLSPQLLAYAYYTPGLMITWNTAGNPGSLSATYSGYASTGYASADILQQLFDTQVAGTASLSATVTPSASVAYGLFYDDLDLFDLSLGYQNPITATLTIPLSDLTDPTLSVTTTGSLVASASVIPGITSALTWSDSYPLFTLTGQV